MARKMEVAVIGAGSAGLCAARHLIDRPQLYNFVVYESQEKVGGTWVYTHEVGFDENGLPIHSSMYKNLRTNLPKEVMAYPDFPFDESNETSFIHHTEVLKYLENYAEHFGLYKFIQFKTVVEEVRPKKTEDNRVLWQVRTKNLVSGVEERNDFDALMVCNGHYSCPNIPNLPGLNSFKGLIMHSHEYRTNGRFKDLVVVVLGAGPSGVDIAVEVAKVACQVILCHNLQKRFPPSVLPNMREEVGISSLTENEVLFVNGTSCKADALILCTGYKYNYSFLHEDCHVTVENQRVIPLYMHLFHTEFPNMGIWGVPSKILPFPIYHQQVMLFLEFLEGRVKLPSREEMNREAERDLQTRLELNMPSRHVHVMPPKLQWEYDDEMAKMGGFQPLLPVVKKLFEYVHNVRKTNLISYKKLNFKLIDIENFHQLNELDN